MKLRTLHVAAFPGLEAGAELRLDGFDADTNLVIGPNASGKSTLVRALRSVLAPDALRSEEVRVVATFDGGDGVWRAERVGRRVAWTRDGRASDPPPGAAGDAFDALTISVDDLTDVTDSDRSAERAIARALAGGYDLDAVRDVPGFDVGARHGQTEEQTLIARRNDLREVERRQEDLRRALAGRDAKIEARDDARAARAEVERLEAALALVEERAARAALEAELATFPSGVAELGDGDADARAEHHTRRNGLLTRRRDAEQNRDDAANQLAATGLAEASVTLADVATLEAAQRDLAAREDDVRRHVTAAREAAAQRDAAAAALRGGRRGGWDDGPEAGADDGVEGAAEGGAPPQVAGAALDVVETDLADLRTREARLVAVEERLVAVEARLEDAVAEARRAAEAAGADDLVAADVAASEATRVAEGDAVRRHRDALRAAGGARPRGVAAASVAALLGALVAGAFELPAWAVAATSAVAAGLAAFAAPRVLGRAGAAPDARAEALDVAAAHLREAARGAADRASLAREAAGLRDAVGAARDALRARADAVGFDPERLHADFARWLHDAHAYADARVRADGAERAATDAATAYAEAADALAAHLAEAGGTPPAGGEAALGGAASAAAFGAALADLRGRVEARDRAREAQDAAERAAANAEEDLAALAEEEARFFARFGLADLPEAERDAAFEVRLEARPRYREREAAFRAAEARIEPLRAKLDGTPELVAQVEAGEREALEAARSDAEARAARADALSEEVAALDARVAAEERGHDLAEARAAERAATEALRDARDAVVFAEAGRWWLDEIEREHGAHATPAVLERAREAFASFTEARYDLRFDPRAEEGARFVAFDRRDGVERTLRELSTGTRMQMLVAVRVAYARHAEAGGPALPVVLDEALTTSDAERFAAVAKSLARLARDEGRQVVYLSARAEDAAAWRAAVADVGGVGVAEHRLAGADAPAGVVDAAALALPAAEAVPDPGDLDAAAYAARLGVPPIDPWRAADAIHVLHLLRDDLPGVATLLRGGVTTLGIADGVDRSAGLTAWLGPERAETLRDRIVAARAWLPAWTLHRARPLDADVLAASGAVSETFFDAVAELVRDVRGDGAALLAALEAKAVPGFRTQKREELAHYLREGGYLADGTPPSSAERVGRMLAALEAAGRPRDPDAVAALDAALEVGVTAGGPAPSTEA
mgnify:CR=1 FL=1